MKQKDKATLCRATRLNFFSPLKKREITLSNEMEEISDFNTYERVLRFLTFLNLPFTLNLVLGISFFFALQTLHVFLKGTVIRRNRKQR